MDGGEAAGLLVLYDPALMTGIRIGSLLALALTFTAVALARPTTAAACSGLVPNNTNILQIRAATICGINAQRARFRLPPVAPNVLLTSAAQGHANNMAARRFFSHGNVGARIRGSGYLRGARRYGYGETLAFDCGANSSPNGIVTRWMNSAFHRRIMLRRAFKHVGIGVVIWTPNGCSGATYVGNFGFR